MNTIILLLALFGIKHFVADFLLQFGYMVNDKGTYGAPGGTQHAILHGILTFFIIIWFTNPFIALLLSNLDSIVHYHIDWAKTNLSQGLTINDHKFWVWFGLDQGLHYLTYILIIGLIVL